MLGLNLQQYRQLALSPEPEVQNVKRKLALLQAAIRKVKLAGVQCPPTASRRKPDQSPGGAIIRRGRPVSYHTLNPAAHHEGGPWGPLLIGLLLLAAVAWYAVRYYTPQIEADLARRSNDALAEEGLTRTGVAIDGRTAILSGSVDSRDQLELAEQTVTQTFGIRTVDNQLTIGSNNETTAEARSQPSFSLTRAGSGIDIAGTVSDNRYAAAIEDATKTHFGADRVNAAITIDPSVTNPGWMSALNQLLPELDNVGNGAVSIEGSTLTLKGSIDAETKDRIGTLATDLTAGQLQVDNQIIAPEPIVPEPEPEPIVAAPEPEPETEAPAVEEKVEQPVAQEQQEPEQQEPQPAAEPQPPKLPAFAAIKEATDTITVNGFMSAEGAEQVLSALDPEKKIINQINIDERAETPVWATQLGESLTALGDNSVENLALTMTRSGSVRLRGVVESEEAKTAVQEVVSDVYGEDYEIANDIAVVVPPPVPTLPPFASVTSVDNTVTIAGLLPPATAKAISSRYRASGKSVIENVTRDERVIEPAWTDAFSQAIDSMPDVENRKVTLNSRGELTIHGIVEDDATRQTANDNLSSLFGDSVSLRNDIQVIPTIVPADELAALFDSIDLSGIRFASNSADLTDSSVAILDQIVDALIQIPDVPVEVSGHTDSAGSYDYNLDLSGERAEAVRSYLTDKGIDGSRLQAEGYGPSRPVASNDTRAGRALNRRIEIKISGE